MNPVQTGIAVAFALVVVAVFFVFPGLSPFSAPQDITTTETTPTTLTMNQQQQNESLNEFQATDIVVGTGLAAEAGDTITAKYVGTLPDGTVFDASANHAEIAGGFEFVLGQGMVIAGWDQGILGMKEGGKRKLVIPPALGYGAAPGHPLANQTLIFEVELVKVTK